jgi:ectoine hydroxylase-related dioxygenase (phytanoyl-CoA dioxygenase family)
MTRLSAAQIAEFYEQGYLVVKNVLDPEEDIAPVIAEYGEVLDRLARELYEGGEITSTYDHLPFGERLTRIYLESGKVHAQYFDFSLPQKGMKADTPFWTGAAVFNALRNEKLLDLAESLVGPEIYSVPVQHVRIKPPEHRLVSPENLNVSLEGGNLVISTPWHQDLGVVLPEADETKMLTVWFPLQEATVENGCLLVVPGSHRNGLLHHCPRTAGIQIPRQFFREEDAVAVPMEAGDVLLMTRWTCHSSLPNRSEGIRWSFDIRYSPTGQSSGRGVFPGFVARSRAHPETELHDPEAWDRMWHEARDLLARQEDPAYNRWSASDPVCA